MNDNNAATERREKTRLVDRYSAAISEFSRTASLMKALIADIASHGCWDFFQRAISDAIP
jgi:hypothetical protein